MFACAFPCFLGLLSVLLFISFSVFCGRARKRPKSEIRHTLHAKTSFFKVRARAGAAPRTTTDGPKKHEIKFQQSVRKHQNIIDFSASRGRPPNIPPKHAGATNPVKHLRETESGDLLIQASALSEHFFSTDHSFQPRFWAGSRPPDPGQGRLEFTSAPN